MEWSDFIGIYGAVLSSILFYFNYMHYKKPVWFIDMSVNKGKDNISNMVMILYNKLKRPLVIINMSLEIKRGKQYEVYDVNILKKDNCFEVEIENIILSLPPILTIPSDGYERFIVDCSHRLKDKYGERKAKFYEREEYLLVICTICGKTYRIKQA